MSQDQKRISVKRWNPLLGEWVIIAPTTAARPWKGALISLPQRSLPEHDINCYLCPSVKRASGQVNPNYRDVYVFENDFPSLSMSYTIDTKKRDHPLDLPAHGIYRVISFSSKHNMTFAEMESAEIAQVLNAFQRERDTLASAIQPHRLDTLDITA